MGVVGMLGCFLIAGLSSAPWVLSLCLGSIYFDDAVDEILIYARLFVMLWID